jgi:hypothetical protein
VTAPATQHITDSVAANAQTDLMAAYGYAQGLSSTGSLPANMDGSTFTPGVYNNTGSAVVGLSTSMTLNANDDPDAVFIFQITNALTTTTGEVNLIHGAQAKNVFWQVGSSATIGANFVGAIMANQSVTLNPGVTLTGRALANDAAVTLSGDNIVTAP